MKLYTKEELIEIIRVVCNQGWHKSVKRTRDTRNDGAVGNTLETLLGIEENNLPIPNAQEWELKGQRSHTSSLITLKHIEPSPRACKIVPNLLLPNYGWRHKNAGTGQPITEMSFRSTTTATNYTKRGFTVILDRKQNKLRFVFDSSKADISDPEVAEWLKWVDERIGLDPFNPEPYWGLEDLRYAIGNKIRNCFYMIADTKVEKSREFFLYKELYILSGFSFEKFCKCTEDGDLLIDFDARTGHNHGTKFRLRQGRWKEIYDDVERAI
ncbi:MAG: MvaI/BcnI restriction endonuclease family protein [Desulfobacteraceae bacterium]|nr:MvaI/BcnI restriction endonuclease family protein [Bacteroidota bacterium]MBL7177099.1 MvaI/BcnI restriction endonuclease family protein [Desulfobacteraceae bacterium]